MKDSARKTILNKISPAKAFNWLKHTSKVFPASLSSNSSPIQAITPTFWLKA